MTAKAGKSIRNAWDALVVAAVTLMFMICGACVAYLVFLAWVAF